MADHGGDAAFGALYERRQTEILAYCIRRLPRDDAVEAASEVFLTAWRRLDDLPAGDRATAWLYGIARNVVRNRSRGGRRGTRLAARLRSLPAESEPDPEAVLLRREEESAVFEAFAELREADRELVRLRLWDELPYEAIAEMLGCSRHAAEQRYVRAMKRLRSAFRRTGHGWVMGTTPFTVEQEGAE